MHLHPLTLPCALSALTTAAAGLTETSLKKHPDALSLDFPFNPIKEAYWTNLPHHRRTPFAISPDGQSAYLAYLDARDTDVPIQQVDPSTFAAVGSAVTVTGGREAGGLVAHDDGGFALLTNEALPSGTADAPAEGTPVPVLYRFGGDGEMVWKTFLGGSGVDVEFGLAASPDLNGDLVFSEEAGLYGAYFVITVYTGSASGHFGDSIKYITTNGTLTTIPGASSAWGCSHNTGIALEASRAPPFASICAADQGAIWLNTQTQGMSGPKISNENTTNGASGEPMGGISGSYSSLARLVDDDAYVFVWVSRGAVDLTDNEWLGGGNVMCGNRTNGRNVAVARLLDKGTLGGEEASSVVGAAEGDLQVNWITEGSADCSNAHVAAFDGKNILVTWEEIEDPFCPVIAIGCQGTFTGTRFQLVMDGVMVGDALVETDTYVAGDMVTMGDGRICWPYISMTWDLSQPVPYGGSTTTTKSMSFACMSLGGGSNSSSSADSSVAVTEDTIASTTADDSTSSFVTSAQSSNVDTTVDSMTTTTSPSTPAAGVTSSSLGGGSGNGRKASCGTHRSRG